MPKQTNKKTIKMTLVEWNEKMSVGVSIIDDEHKQLLGMLNQLYDAMQAKQSSDALAKVVDGLIAYTVYHFKHEEALFARTGYPCTAEHEKEHADLTKQVLEVQKKYRAGDTATLSPEVLNFLRKWLLAHILRSDKKYGPHLNANGIV
jgi:hemerythrin-like metal-binding protein